MRLAATLLATLLAATPAWHGAWAQTRTHALSLIGEPQLPADFTHFPHVNPDAPKGGEAVLAATGTFDSFNPFIIWGSPAAGSTMLWETLLKPNADEASAEYANIAEAVELAEDRSWVAFILREGARFHDDRPITAEDVEWTFAALREHGRPIFRSYYAGVSAVETDGPRRVVFRLSDPSNRELPLILGQLPVLPKHWFEGRDFTRPLTDPPVGSGAYRIDRFEFGRSVAYRRVPGWWGEDLPAHRGTANFDVLRYEYFRDLTVAFEAFKAGQVDLRFENIASNWATGYDFPAVRDGRVIRAELPHRLPTGMQAFAFNTRRAVFADRRVREALMRLFDFEWLNANLFHGQYTRTTSYFSNSEFAATGLPEGAELALLERHRDRVPPELFTRPFTLPVTDGSGNNREQYRVALGLLRDAGWTIRDRRLVDAQGRQMAFEITLDSPSFERVALPYVQALQRLGAAVSVRTVEAAQYQRRTDEFDYDMVVMLVPQSDSPGNEQRDFWTCAERDKPGSRNVAGICDPVVDALVETVINAPDREALITATRALDRVLLWGHHVIPQWHSRKYNVAYWNHLARPERPVRTGFAFDTWWSTGARPQ